MMLKVQSSFQKAFHKHPVLWVLVFFCTIYPSMDAQFIHPGGLHNLEDLQRMKKKVQNAERPWIEGWNELIQDPLAQNTYKASPLENLGRSRQNASKDAHAAYLNAIRGYISGDTSYIRTAIEICNAWSKTVNQVPTGRDIPGLSGIPIAEFAMVGEILRIYVPDQWKAADFDQFKTMMVEFFYPVCHNFLENHNGYCIDYFWANWDACNIMALVSMGVLCDNNEIFNEGIEYFKHGAGTGSIRNAVVKMHANGLGQWQESGRDQSHAQLGIGFLGTVCEIAWKQGIDLYGVQNNRLLAGAEYVAQYNLWKEVPFTFYDNCQLVNHNWPAINGRGIFHDRPVYEMLYNHYVIRKVLPSKNVQLMAEITRPEKGSKDHFGYGTLTFTLESSPLPVFATPPQLEKLEASAGVDQIFLRWQPAKGNTIQGYVVKRAENPEGPFTTIAEWKNCTTPFYTDVDVEAQKTYYYRVAGQNYAGVGIESKIVSSNAQVANGLPTGWKVAKIGDEPKAKAKYSKVAGGTFVVEGSGNLIGETADDVTYVYTKVKGNQTLIVRLLSVKGKNQKTGIMFRESLLPNAKTASMTLGDLGGRFAQMGFRTSENDTTHFILGNAYTWFPAWFKLENNRGKIRAWESPDGEKWFLVEKTDLKLPKAYFVGLVVSNGNNNQSSTAVFDHVSLLPSK